MINILKKLNLPRFWVVLLPFCLAGSLHAQDTLKLTGKWKIQPATTSGTFPRKDNWGWSNGIDQQSNWLWEKTSGLDTPWANIQRDSVNSIWYEREFVAPLAWTNRRVVIDFTRIDGDAIIFCNRQRVAELLRPGGEVELTPYVQYGKSNVLQVFVTRNYTDISRGFTDDPLRYQVRQLSSNTRTPASQWSMGITAAVSIIARPQQALTYVACITSFRKKTLSLQIDADAKHPQGRYKLEAVVTDKDGREVLHFSSPVTLTEGTNTYTISSPWANPVCWELDRPYLYKVGVRLEQNDKTISTLPDQKFGFREIWTAGNKLYMNGHLSRWRLTDLYSTNNNGLSFYRLMGYNVGQVQPASGLWWSSNQAETPMMNEAMLNEMDRLGMGVTLPGPSVTVLRGMLLGSAKAREDYRREAAFYIRRYFNHPCILAWVISMNSVNPKANIWPQFMGKRDTTFSTQAKVIQQAYHLVKQVDTTRLVYSHADGSEGDVSTANVYLNFVPLQEREEWPMEWARNGNMPYSAVEFGTPYWNNFWRGKQFLLTEFIAMYLGDEAYQREKAGALKSTIGLGLTPVNTTWESVDFKQFPAFWTFQRLFTHNTNRAWRTWGVNAGWLNWLLEGYGDPPGKKVRWIDRYKSLKEPVNSRPDWASPRFDIFSEDNHPLLAWLAGYPVPTNKTHAFFSGEPVKKQISIVWDGHTDETLNVNWTLKQGARLVKQSRQLIPVKAGSNNLLPLVFVAPEVRQRTLFKLLLSVRHKKTELLDTLLLDVFPKLKPIINQPEVMVYDPAGRTTAWLHQLGIKAKALQKGEKLQPGKTLIIGCEALQPGDKMPYTLDNIYNGQKVIVMEQLPQVWEGLGFETIESMPRYVFIRDRHNPILKNIYPRDLVNWRGSPNLLPEGRQAREYDTQHAPKWTNRHAVASVALKIPQAVGFIPLLQTEFDMAYTPLLEWQHGKGKITFCSLDLTGRVGVDPVATRLARQLIAAQTRPDQPTRRVFYAGDETGHAILQKLNVPFTQDKSDTRAIWMIGSGKADIKTSEIEKHVALGGRVLYLSQSDAQLGRWGFKVNAKDFWHVTTLKDNELLRAIGPNLLRVRDSLKLPLFEATGQPGGAGVLLDGLLLAQHAGKGQKVYLQLSPQMLENRYANDPDRKEAIQLSVLHLYDLLGRLLTNMGVGTDVVAAQNMVAVNLPLSFQPLGSWKLMGPYLPESVDGKVEMETVYPGEQDAIDGAENPNLTYKRPDGQLLDWRRVVDADRNGYVDLSKAFSGKDENAVAYVTKIISSDAARLATIKLGVDFWMKAWMNGKPVLMVVTSHQKRPNEYVLDVPLKKGENVITLKVGSGRGGFGFWASLSQQTTPKGYIQAAAEHKSLYVPLFKNFDPYQFNYW